MSDAAALTGLVLTGGGARAAYQIGVLKAIAQVRRDARRHARQPVPGDRRHLRRSDQRRGAGLPGRRLRRRRSRSLCDVWENFRAEQVYRADSFGVIRTGARWLTMFSVGWAIARWRKARPRSLLDNTPLEGLLEGLISPERLRRIMADGHLHALAITASSYGSGLHVTFYDSVGSILPWTRSQRLAVRADDRRAAPARLVGDPVRLPGRAAEHRRPHGVLRRRLDAPGGADLAGGAPRRRAHPGRRRRTHARAAGRARRQQRVSEPGADRRPRAVEHLPRRAGGRRRAPAAHQCDAALLPPRRAPRPA